MDAIRLSVIIPMYNEEDAAEPCASALTAYLDTLCPERDYEIIFSNDGSTDRCGAIIEALADDRIRLCGYPDNRGKGSAVREGILTSRGRTVVYTDCDLAYGTEVIGKAEQLLLSSGADIVIGSRNLSADGYAGYTPMRKFMSRTYLRMIRIMTGFDSSDSQCGIKCMNGEVARQIFSQCVLNGFSFDLELLQLAKQQGRSIAELPVKIINHRESRSKVNPVKDALRMLGDVRRIKKLHPGGK